MTSWAEEEVKTAALGDQRLNKRLVKVLDHLGQHPQFLLIISKMSMLNGLANWS